MKRRILFLILTVSLLLGVCSLPVSATTYPAEVVFDNADLLTADAETAIQDAVHQAREKSGCAFYVVTYEVPEGENSYVYQYRGMDFLSEHGLSENTDLILLVITLDRGVYYYDMYYYGAAPRHISQKEVDYILDHKDVYNNLKSGKLEEGTCAFLALSAQAFSGRVGVSYVVIALICFGIALVVGILACVGVKAKYAMKMRSVDYPLDRFAKMELKEKNDVFVGSFVTKRVIETNHGGGRGGGGSSHGGGGGHAGGR